MKSEDDSIKSFEDLDCWKICRELRKFISELVKKYPKEEKYRLVNDMLRSSRSLTYNIAEGYGRFHYQENIQFCRISRGSLYELKDQIICSLDEGFINDADYKKSLEMIKRASSLLNGYINYLSSKVNKK
ncbi:hypothetical protein BMS3Abin10_01160 [bacterium BMS3Abin10]|nr:hypothetical protein BMS3Abin10_01160 [bacterium BMS3Abin10]GBE38092.1 hypothetical protein BMS3Bbin08_00694 [bacterium BMS3Bbin08]